MQKNRYLYPILFWVAFLSSLYHLRSVHVLVLRCSVLFCSCDTTDLDLLGSSVHGIFLARILVAIILQSPGRVWLWFLGLQYTRPPCPSPSPEVCPSSFPLHQWCHPAISSSDALFSFCLQPFPASGTFPMGHLFTSDDKNTGASASALVLPVNSQGWPPLRLTGLISLQSKGLSGVFSSTTVQRHRFFGALPSLQSSS